MHAASVQDLLSQANFPPSKKSESNNVGLCCMLRECPSHNLHIAYWWFRSVEALTREEDGVGKSSNKEGGRWILHEVGRITKPDLATWAASFGWATISSANSPINEMNRWNSGLNSKTLTESPPSLNMEFSELPEKTPITVCLWATISATPPTPSPCTRATPSPRWTGTTTKRRLAAHAHPPTGEAGGSIVVSSRIWTVNTTATRLTMATTRASFGNFGEETIPSKPRKWWSDGNRFSIRACTLMIAAVEQVAIQMAGLFQQPTTKTAAQPTVDFLPSAQASTYSNIK